MENKEEVLYSRKGQVGFMERLYKYFKYDFEHDIYKAVMYGEGDSNTKLMNRIKSMYDGYEYLLRNSRRKLTREVIKKFYYIVYEEQIKEEKADKLATEYFKIAEEEAIERSNRMYRLINDTFDDKSEEERIIIGIMFLNYVLVKENMKAIRLTQKEIDEFIKIRKEKDKTKEFENLLKLVRNTKSFTKEYIKNLKPLTLKEICEGIKEDVKNDEEIKEIIIYGSYAKAKERIDSDVDMLVRLSDDLTYEQRIQKIEGLEERLAKKLKRKVDIHEISKYISDELIRSASKKKIIVEKGMKE